MAESVALGHWDTYGQMTHNYYLYNDPAAGKLTWISWDHSFVLGAGPGGDGAGRRVREADAPQAGGAGAAPGSIGGRGNVSPDRDTTGANWPLIRYLLDQPAYHDDYIGYLEETVRSAMDPTRLEAS